MLFDVRISSARPFVVDWSFGTPYCYCIALHCSSSLQLARLWCSTVQNHCRDPARDKLRDEACRVVSERSRRLVVRLPDRPTH